MKLHTQMQWTTNGKCEPDPFTLHSPTDTLPETIHDFIHDTVAAHALMHALEEAYATAKSQPSTKQVMWITQYQMLKDIRDRSDELMHEWGFKPVHSEQPE